ncbi:unnamed protein product, partial [Sphenostylis stenocarpa]
MSQGTARCATGFLILTRALSTEARAEKVERIANELLDLNRFERHDFTVLWRLKMGLHRYGAPVAGVVMPSVAAAGSPREEPGATAEKTAFDLKLEKYDAAAKIKIIKEVRSFTDLGLKEAKDLVEKVPCVLKKGLTKEEANPIMEKLKELGAAVVLEMEDLNVIIKNFREGLKNFKGACSYSILNKSPRIEMSNGDPITLLPSRKEETEEESKEYNDLENLKILEEKRCRTYV